MWDRGVGVKYWQPYDNKCQWRQDQRSIFGITCLLLSTYSKIDLAQKLLYNLSPIKKNLLVKEIKTTRSKKGGFNVKKSERFYTD
jgi:hypothetical protein